MIKLGDDKECVRCQVSGVRVSCRWQACRDGNSEGEEDGAEQRPIHADRAVRAPILDRGGRKRVQRQSKHHGRAGE